MESGQLIEYCTKLPEEVWLRCFRGPITDEEAPHLQSLAAVCRYFQELFQPLLFRDMELIVRKEQAEIPHVKRSTVRLKDLAASNHALSVKSWTFSLEPSGGRQPTHSHVAQAYSEVIRIFCTTLGAYQNLRSLSLRGLTIDAPLRDILTSLEKLEKLALADCIILARTGSPLPLYSFSLSGSQSSEANQPLHLVSPTTLRSLTLDGSAESSAFLKALQQHDTLTHLERLCVHLSDLVMGPFLRFLEYCPQVAHIEIPDGSSTLSVRLPDHLPRGAAPSLRSFNGPESMAGLLIYGRPVSDVELFGDSRIQGVWSQSITALSYSSAALRRLSLEVPVAEAEDIATVVAAEFPQLEELSLRVLGLYPFPEGDDPRKVMQVMLQALYDFDLTKPPFAEFVQRLCADDFPIPVGLVVLQVAAARMQSGDFLPFNLETQHDIVLAFARRSLPALLQITLGDSDGTWTRYGNRWRERRTDEEINSADDYTGSP
ncbi:hypothetical protein B0H13DRAFT_1988361 [Mycena leptocephala]|nr:hypothetical protein B0H13DRAFT_1988361 [Mycena leptocephala]